jgi:hypothetical protein
MKKYAFIINYDLLFTYFAIIIRILLFFYCNVLLLIFLSKFQGGKHFSP